MTLRKGGETMALNVNEASQEELEALPGVGSATAEKLMKARPIADGKELEGIIPPSAWLKIREEGVEFAFGEADGDPADDEVAEPRPKGKTVREDVAPEPIVKMHDPDPVSMRRLMPGQELKAGAEYMCVWNAKHGPHGEAWVPEDAPVQAEIEGWFLSKGMSVKFAHYGPSIRLGTANRGMVNLVLFEIIKKQEEIKREEDKDGDGNGSGRKEGD